MVQITFTQLLLRIDEKTEVIENSPESRRSVGTALSQGSTAKPKPRHIHRTSIATNKNRRNSSTSSFHHRRSSCEYNIIYTSIVNMHRVMGRRGGYVAYATMHVQFFYARITNNPNINV